MKVFSGVGGGVGVEKGFSLGFAWWGEGRRIVCVGDISWGKEICLIRDKFETSSNDIESEGVVSDGKAGSPAPPLDQNASQRS